MRHTAYSNNYFIICKIQSIFSRLALTISWQSIFKKKNNFSKEHSIRFELWGKIACNIQTSQYKRFELEGIRRNQSVLGKIIIIRQKISLPATLLIIFSFFSSLVNSKCVFFWYLNIVLLPFISKLSNRIPHCKYTHKKYLPKIFSVNKFCLSYLREQLLKKLFPFKILELFVLRIKLIYSSNICL